MNSTQWQYRRWTDKPSLQNQRVQRNYWPLISLFVSGDLWLLIAFAIRAVLAHFR